jgi:hypothetical protein
MEELAERKDLDKYFIMGKQNEANHNIIRSASFQ